MHELRTYFCDQIVTSLNKTVEWIRKHKVKATLIGLLVFAFLWYLFCLPRDIFAGTSYSTVVTDRNGELLGAKIADDGQWRFPPSDTIPDKYRTALVEFEDRYYYWHPGINPVSIVRAAVGNIKAGHVTSGGSTITMQVIRMSRGKERTIFQKFVESILATRLELRYSKKRILALYASHAPYGGNVVGLEAASWRYFGRPSSELSWGEAATLAVLPNSPSSIHLSRNRGKLLEKRNRLLHDLLADGKISAEDCDLACGEPLPGTPLAIPQYAPHLTEWYSKIAKGKESRTSIDLHFQRQVEETVDRWNDEFSLSGINDLAAIVMDVHTGNILAYCGNANPQRKRQGSQVDILRSPRSTGSILKPFLYCAMLQDGDILPYSLVQDTPVNINGFTPQNFDMQFSGAVPAAEALARSLNVPAVHMLRKYGVQKFLELLRKAGMTTMNRSAGDYGLSLILGGGEGTLLDITSMYASLSRAYQSKDSLDFPLKDKCAIWYTFNALKEVNRPDEIDWRLITSVKKIAWKTGTSYGFRDAWAVGVTPDYAVGVWAGNAEGEGVPGLTGASTSGPVMFDIFNLLPKKETHNAYAEKGWFLEPLYKDYITAEVCHESGYLKGLYCDDVDTLILPRKAIKSETCPYHKQINGEDVFQLPPSMEWYYRQHHPEYKQVVETLENDNPMQFIYPDNGSFIYIPRQLDGTIKGIVFNLAHRHPENVVYWHLDNEYLGETKYIHQMTLAPAVGKHTVTVVDAAGNTLSIGFTIVPNRPR
jgi:penicillin-binding protein 1C